ncbi:class I SAM-dependent DNA methyltransferase [Amycolatopsis sp. NPDC059657]|uniref:class I SAM-dependent DNA methyltransferase n=1 Tax=Amycolatopsis sp. NPDC059657 TaxID=3346899 RepID=UPI00366D68A6
MNAATEPPHLSRTRESYDTVAEDYVDVIVPRFHVEPLGRAMLSAFAELVDEPVADIGCGPGQVTAHLNELGVRAFGIDLSPKMIEIARRTYPELRFEVGTMTALDLPDGELGGIVAWWSIFHTPPELLPTVFAEFHRTLAPGGHAVLGFHAGDEHLKPTRAYGHPVTYEAYRLRPDRVAELLGGAGFTVTARLLWEENRPQAVLLARKTERS